MIIYYLYNAHFDPGLRSLGMTTSYHSHAMFLAEDAAKQANWQIVPASCIKRLKLTVHAYSSIRLSDLKL